MTAPLARGVRAPRQSRGHESLERLLEAGAAVIAEQGFGALTVGDVVRRARSSVGVFYARFADKEALLRCLHERFCAQALGSFETAFAPARWEGQSAEAIVRAAVAGLLAVERGQAGLVRAFVLAAGSDPSYAERAARVGEQVGARLRALLLARRAELAHPEPGAAIDFALWLTLAHLDQRAVYGSVATGTSRLSHAARTAAMADVILAYLGIRSTARRATPSSPSARPARRPHEPTRRSPR